MWYHIIRGHHRTTKYALLAQLVEHLTLNQGVRGSSPRWRTKTKILSQDGIFCFVRVVFGNEIINYIRKNTVTVVVKLVII